MGESKVKFGDKFFLYGKLLTLLEDYEEYEYNSIIGYMTMGGYDVDVVETDIPLAALPGFVVDAQLSALDAVATPFSQMEMVDVTGKLSWSLPLPPETKVWLPTRPLG